MISAAVETQGERFSNSAGGPTSLVDLPNAVRPVVSHNPNRKKVLFVTSEFADLVKTGGLGDVSAALPRAKRLYITEVDAAPEGDAVFPDFDASAFVETASESHGPGEKDDHAFVFVPHHSKPAG